MTTSISSPFLADDSCVESANDSGDIDLDQLAKLMGQALDAKGEFERQKAIYDALRDQICASLRELGETKLETATAKARLKETKSGWTYSQTTEALAIQLKAQQDIEKRNGTAQPGKVTISADVLAL